MSFQTPAGLVMENLLEMNGSVAVVDDHLNLKRINRQNVRVRPLLAGRNDDAAIGAAK